MIRRLLLALALIVAATTAQAACTVPVTLANGTLADAGQVMQNFNAIITCINNSLGSWVIGPTTSTVNHVALFNNTTGNGVGDGGLQLGANVTNSAYAGGADPTGVGDSTLAIRAAITAALGSSQPAIFFPAGTYRFTDTIVASGITINCQGNNSTHLLFDDASLTKDGFTVGNATFNMRSCGYDRMQAGQLGALIHLTDSNWVQIDHNSFQDPSSACLRTVCAHAWNVIYIDSAVQAPFEISIHDNYYANEVNDFVFSNSQNAALPMYDLHIFNNSGFSNGRAHYEMQGYGQFDLHDNAMCCGATYDVYMNMVDNVNVNNLSRFAGNDFDTASGTSIYMVNENAAHFENNNVGKMTFINDPGLVFDNNQCLGGGTTGCEVLIQGMIGGKFNNNRIYGTNNPITIQPNGTTASSSLSFQDNEWFFSVGSFLTFNGGTPVADDIKVNGTHINSNNEILATFTNAPTNWRATGDFAGPGLAATFNTCTGVGATGTCNTFSPVGTMEGGTIVLNTSGGGEASIGIVKMTYPAPLGPSGSTCTLTPQSGTGLWVTGVSVIQDGTTGAYMQFHWVNGGATALTDNAQYNIEFACHGY